MFAPRYLAIIVATALIIGCKESPKSPGAQALIINDTVYDMRRNILKTTITNTSNFAGDFSLFAIYKKDNDKVKLASEQSDFAKCAIRISIQANSSKIVSYPCGINPDREYLLAANWIDRQPQSFTKNLTPLSDISKQ